MAQQVGRGAAPAAQETEATPGGMSGGASGIAAADSSQNGTGVSQGTKAGQDDEAGQGIGGDHGTLAGRGDTAGQGAKARKDKQDKQDKQGKPGRVRGWLRRNPQGAITVTQAQAPN